MKIQLSKLAISDFQKVLIQEWWWLLVELQVTLVS